CVASCYTPDQKILFVDGEHEIYDAFTKKLTNIIALSDSSSLDNISYQVKGVEAYSESIIETVHNIRVFNTVNGGQLKVTDNHPLLLSTGYMQTAENIKVGDSLISKDGSFDEIINIEDVKFTGKVYNVMPDTSDKSTNGQIVVAQGFLSGSMYYQNDGADLTGRLLLRSQVPSDLL
ncbi:cell surface protein, partial [Vibrio agarivorans]